MQLESHAFVNGGKARPVYRTETGTFHTMEFVQRYGQVSRSTGQNGIEPSQFSQNMEVDGRELR